MASTPSDGFLSSPSSDDTFDFLFKVVLIGDCGAGKTCVVQRFKSGNFVERHGNTIGVDFSMKTVTVDGKKVKARTMANEKNVLFLYLLYKLLNNTRDTRQLQIWDTAGQERFRTITQSYYRSANGVIIVYDITKRSSFLNLQRWIEEVRRYTASNVLLVLIALLFFNDNNYLTSGLTNGKILTDCGNKCDMETLREVEFAEAEAMCEYIPEILYVMETSARENTNVEQAFMCLATELKRRHDHTAYLESSSSNVVKLGESRVVRRCSSCGSF